MSGEGTVDAPYTLEYEGSPDSYHTPTIATEDLPEIETDQSVEIIVPPVRSEEEGSNQVERCLMTSGPTRPCCAPRVVAGPPPSEEMSASDEVAERLEEEIANTVVWQSRSCQVVRGP